MRFKTRQLQHISVLSIAFGATIILSGVLFSSWELLTAGAFMLSMGGMTLLAMHLDEDKWKARKNP